MMKYQMFSIIIPVYNAEKSIIQLLKKIRNTMYYKTTEIIMIDDGSTDRSYSVLEQEVISANSEILIHQENQGVSAARNIGLQHATGKYILFFDADDQIDVAAYDKMTKRVVKDEADISVFGIKDVFHQAKNKVKVIENYTEDQRYTMQEYYAKFGVFLNQQILYSPCNKVYKREIINKANIKFDERYAIGEDMLFNLDYFQTTHSFAMYPEYVYLYQHNAGMKSGSTHYHANFYESLKLIVEKITALLKEQGAYEENATALNEFLLSKVSYGINNLFFADSPLSDEERKKFITSLYDETIIMDALRDKHVKMKGIDQKLMKLLHQKKQVDLIFNLYKFRNSIR